MNHEIYLDANATTPALPAAIAAAADALGGRFGNPSSSHAAGLKAKAMLDAVRARARLLLGAGAGRLMFTSGATEGIQTAVLSALCDIRARQLRGEEVGELLLYGATEHKAVPESLAHWNSVLGTGLALHALPVDPAGLHRLDLLRDLAPRAAMLCTMAANNETGVISDLAAIEALLAECAPAALWMVDSVQALGKLHLDLAATRIDYAPFSGHKLYAPKGIGMLYVRAGAPYTALMMGGGQEGGQRSGTENMSGIAALGAVLAALEEGGAFASHAQLVDFRDRLAAALRQAFPAVVFNAPFGHALPTTLNFSVPGQAGKQLLDLFDAAGIRVSAGSACSASKAAPSYVLDAMGLPAWRSSAAVRLSFGPMADAQFIDAACERILRCGAALRAADPQPLAADTVLWPGLDPSGALPAIGAAFTIAPAALEEFLLAHPDACFIDVRDAVEHAVAGAHLWHGRRAESVPLSRLPQKAAEWLRGEQHPLVFFCRSGNRSAKAADCMHRLGYHNAWHLAGGMALASA
jgi:cysteine desulfurase